jgi:hypothetical protein
MAARMHRLKVPGRGELIPQDHTYAGTATSWADYVQASLERRIEQLPAHALPQDMAGHIRRFFSLTRPVLEMAVSSREPSSTLVHGDFRLQNVLLLRPGMGGIQVSALLEFEMVHAGDGLVDLAWLIYLHGKTKTDLVSILNGYGEPIPTVHLRQRLQLYQLSYALEHLCWLVGFALASRSRTCVLYTVRMALPSLYPRCEELEDQVAALKGTAGFYWALWQEVQHLLAHLPRPGRRGSPYASYVDEVQAFVNAVLNDKPVPVTGDDGRAPVVIPFAAAKSVRERRTVLLSEITGA